MIPNQEMDTITKPVKAVRASIRFTDHLEVDGYMLPNGEFRIGKAGASLICGFEKNYLGRLRKEAPNQFKALQGEGFTGYVQLVEINIDRGSIRSETISLDDFESLIFFGAEKGKKECIALLRSLVKMGLIDFCRLSFGQQPLTLEEKRQIMSAEYAKTINWTEEDILDALIIENHQNFLMGKY